jgi:hypothetical protein
MAILKENFGLSNEDMRKLRSMRPGMPLDLQVTSGTAIKRVRTEFVGMDVGRNLIMKFPDETKWGNLGGAIYPDGSLITRYILEDENGEIIAFKVKVIMVLSKPSHLIFTTFPMAIQSHGLRSERRAQTRLPLTVFDGETGVQICTGLVLDISNSGCRFGVKRSKIPPKLSAKQAVRLKIDNLSGESIDLNALVMNVKNDDIMIYFGVKFDAAEDIVEALISKIIVDY